MADLEMSHIASPNTLIYFHGGVLPRYLRWSLESDRQFNPSAQIFLISDQVWPTDWPDYKVECLSLSSLSSPELADFRTAYEHWSSLSLEFEKTCIERWFYIAQAMVQLNVGRSVYFDSDCVCFASLAKLCEGSEPDKMYTSKGGSAACALLTRGIQEFVDYILTAYQDTESRGRLRERFEKQKRNVTDMTLWENFAVDHPEKCASYPNVRPGGYIDHSIIDCADDFVLTTIAYHGKRKKVFWHFEDGLVRPYFQQKQTKRRVPAYTLHFLAETKGMMRCFNPACLRYPALGWVWEKILNWKFS